MYSPVHEHKPALQVKSASFAKPGLSYPGPSREAQSISQGQHTLGEQAVQLSQQASGEEHEDNSFANISPLFSFAFDRIPTDARAQTQVQPKLMINTPGDRYEREADQTADQVMRMQEPQLPEHVETNGAMAAALPSIVQKEMRSSGQVLPEPTRKFMESRFGHDFSQVRIHAGSDADEAARAIHARAFTLGHDIVFGPAQYAPNSASGRRLLAHELTHVIQQTSYAGMARQVQRQTGPGVTPLATLVVSSSIDVPRKHGDVTGSRDTPEFFVRLPATLDISATANYIGSSTNRSDWSAQLFRSTMWGEDEPKGTRHGGSVGDTLSFSVNLSEDWTPDFYLRFRNASEYEEIRVSYSVSRR